LQRGWLNYPTERRRCWRLCPPTPPETLGCAVRRLGWGFTIRTFAAVALLALFSRLTPGWTIAPFYDSLIAKLIVWAPDRPEALDRMRRALGEFHIDGPGMSTTIGFHERVFAHPVFRSGDFYTNFIERHMSS
jgi:pyruvate carboxylase